MSNNDDRDENFLIDVLGIWVPECELVFYGLLSDLKYRDELYKGGTLKLTMGNQPNEKWGVENPPHCSE